MNPLLRSMCAAAGFAAAVLTQAPDAATAALARAQVLEHQESDPGAAEQAYRALLADGGASSVHAEAALRLGTLLWRLDRRDDGKPFLERAVAAGGDVAAHATAVLQGQDEQGKQAAERLTKARALVALYQELSERPRDDKGAWDDATTRRRTEVANDLRLLGPEAATAIVEALHKLDDIRKNSSSAWTPGKEAARRGLAYWLWQVGTKPAIEALIEWSQSRDVAERRAIAEGTGWAKVATDLEPVLLTFVRDPDPAGEVWRAVVDSVAKLTTAQHVQLAGDTDPALAAAGLRGLATAWHELKVADREPIVAQLGASIQRATSADDARLSQSAWGLLKVFATYGPQKAQSLFLAEAHRYPSGLGSFGSIFVPEINDAFLHELTEAARRVGRQRSKKQADGAGWLVSELLLRGNAAWTSNGVDDALTLFELGYGSCAVNEGTWVELCLRFATADQLSRLIRALPDAAEQPALIQALSQAKMPAAVFPALRDIVETCLGDGAPPWGKRTQGQSRMVRGKQVVVRSTNDSLLGLCSAIANTRSPDAATWLASTIDRDPTMASIAARLLIAMSGNSVGAPAHDGLRKLLAWPGTDVDELQPQERSEVFAELARVGDVAAIPLYPRAHELGLRRTSISRTGYGFSAAGIGFLADRRSYDSRRPGGPWHAYRAPDLIAAWRTLLESPVADQVWAELCFGDVPQPGAGRPNQNNRDFEIPQAVLPLLCAGLPARWAEAKDKNEFQNAVLTDFRRIPKAAVVGDTELPRALRGLLQADDTWLAFSVFSALTPDVGAVFADEARAALRRAPYKGYVERLLLVGIELPVDDWRELLRHQERNGLVEVLKGLPPKTAATLRREVAATITHDHPDVRIVACQAMQRLYAGDAVPDLLPLLQDPSDDVRKAARTSLDQLREEHERRAFWANANGIDVSPAATAAKLLAQAKAGEAKDQRLLALRSLAVLCAAESLPYLIDWTKDPDAEIVAAARAAITTIHQRAAAPTEPAKK